VNRTIRHLTFPRGLAVHWPPPREHNVSRSARPVRYDEKHRTTLNASTLRAGRNRGSVRKVTILPKMREEQAQRWARKRTHPALIEARADRA